MSESSETERNTRDGTDTVRPPALRRAPARRGRYADDELAGQRDAVVARATHVFLEHGVGGASFQAIAREAHVSPKTIYAWFGGKRGLFTAVLERMIGEMSKGLAETLDPTLPLERALEAFGLRLLDLVLSPELLQLYRIVTAEAFAMPGVADTFERAGPRRGLELLVRHLESRAVPEPELAAEAFIAAVQGRALRRALLGVGTVPTPAERRRRVAYAVGLVAATAPRPRRARSRR